MGLVYSKKAAAAANPCANGPSGWDSFWAFPGPPWAPGWPIPAPTGTGTGYAVVVTVPANITIGGTFTVTGTITNNGADDSVLQCHNMVITAYLNGVAVNVSTDNATWVTYLQKQVTNYTGSSYGISQAMYVQGGSSGDVLTIQICINSVTANLCGSSSGIMGSVVARGYHFAVAKIFAYTPGSDSWAAKSTTSAWPNELGAAAAIGSSAYAFTGSFGTVNTSCSSYAPSGDAWTSITAITLAKAYASGMNDGTTSAYVFGGHVSSTTAGSTDVQAYSSGGNSWSAKTSFSVARQRAMAFSLLGLGYYVGGISAGIAVATNEQFNPTLNNWALKTALPSTGRDGSAAAVNNLGYILYFNSASASYQYTPGTDAWATGTVAPFSAIGPAGTGIGNYGYSFGGSKTQQLDPNTGAGGTWTQKSTTVNTLLSATKATTACTVSS